MQANLPWITRAAGIGGRIKLAPAHFVVEEIALYPACGEGEHVYLTLRRENQTTMQVVERLARLFRVDPRAIGYAGLKDKLARATQTFSLQLLRWNLEEVAHRLETTPELELLALARHRNKLRRGHLLGNRFELLISEPQAGALGGARLIADELARTGLPNFYGEQRLGANDRNVEQGKQLLAQPKPGWQARLMLSAWQSSLFNAWLVERLERGWFARCLTGDVAKLRVSGGLFTITDEELEAPRVRAREIVATGPMFGARMRAAGGEPGDLERALLARSGVSVEELARARLQGTRRAGRIFVDDLALAERPGGLCLRFSLPKGSYATVLAREFLKTQGALPALESDDDAAAGELDESASG